jgi:hypothetical protein
VHAFDAAGSLTAIGWVEGESRLGRRLAGRILHGRPWAELDEGACVALAHILAPAFDSGSACEFAHACWRGALKELVGEADPDPALNPGVAAVLEHLRRAPSPPPSIGELAAIAHPSASRL